MIRFRPLPFDGLSTQRCCRASGTHRSLVYRKAPMAKEPPEGLEGLLERFPAYGYRRVAAALGFSPKRARTLMSRLGLSQRPRLRKKEKPCGSFQVACSNLLPHLSLRGPRRVLAGDVTCVRIKTRGFAYLAVVLDVFTRQVVGWAVSGRNDSALTRAALESVLCSSHLEGGWIHHSDRGSNYTCPSYRKLVADLQGLSSYSDPGRPTQNAFVESFFKSFKLEEGDLEVYEDVDDVREAVQGYLCLYNQERLHSSLGMKSPDQFYMEFLRAS